MLVGRPQRATGDVDEEDLPDGLRGWHSLVVMVRRAGPSDEGSSTARLAAFAVQLREAATEAGRLDVAEKADEAIALLAEADTPMRDGGQEQGRRDTANAVLRMLDGLGF